MAATDAPRKLVTAHLPNPVQIHPKVISGGLPENELAWAELRDLGVRTVISVDGATPDVATAKRYGLRYIHLPHGYDGISQERIQQLAKAVRDCAGPIYLHCHHGKHRSPAAASAACVAAGLTPPDSALAVLQLAGTSPHYRGLFQTARQVKTLPTELLDAFQTEFPERAEVPPLAVAMVALEHTNEHLKLIAKHQWHTPSQHPDLDPAHEALLLREHFTELLRDQHTSEQPEAYRQLLQDSENTVRKLEDLLRVWQALTNATPPPAQLSRLYDQLQANCVSCHQQFRDIPLSEKFLTP